MRDCVEKRAREIASWFKRFVGITLSDGAMIKNVKGDCERIGIDENGNGFVEFKLRISFR